MQSLLANITPADIRTDPFPHVVARDVLPADLYADLCAGFPSFAEIAWNPADRPPPSNRRFDKSTHMLQLDERTSPAWVAFSTWHASAAFYAQVVALFADHWPAALRRVMGGDMTGLPCRLLRRWELLEPGMVTLDARIEINTPVTGAGSVSRGPHLDTPNRLYSCLFYLRHPDDDSVGGDLELYRWRQGPTGDIAAFQQPAAAVEHVATIPYRANQMVIFPQGIDALHGVSLRHPTPHMRRYVFITAEIAADWLLPPVPADA